MIDIDQEDSYLDQCMQDYYEKKYRTKKKNVPKEIVIFSVNDMW